MLVQVTEENGLGIRYVRICPDLGESPETWFPLQRSDKLEMRLRYDFAATVFNEVAVDEKGGCRLRVREEIHCIMPEKDDRSPSELPD